MLTSDRGRGVLVVELWYWVGGVKKAIALAVAVLALGLFAGTASAAVSGWSIVPSPAPLVPHGFLSGVSCPNASSCIAVGHSTSSAGVEVTLAERWDGTRWRIQPTPTLRGGGTLTGVACTSPSACIAVGRSPSFGATVTLAERWNGTRWRIQPTPTPAGGGVLAGVACTSATACTAVGSSNDGSTLAERWNGTTWQIQPTPSPTVGSRLLSVACTSSTACTAVGTFPPTFGQDLTLAEQWNGSQWQVQPTPNPLGTLDSSLRSVACTSSAACTAVGINYPRSTGSPVTLAERWNGISWEIQSTPNPSGSQFSILTGTACTSPSECTAVGSSDRGLTLVEQWHGPPGSNQPEPQ